MKGFKEFLMRGNLIELATAVIIGTAFATVVKAFTDILLDIVGKLGGTPNFSSVAVAGINLGAFLSAVFAFLLTAAVLYFGVIMPYTKFTELRKADEPEAAPASAEDLLGEIRDLLRVQAGKNPAPTEPPAGA